MYWTWLRFLAWCSRCPFIPTYNRFATPWSFFLPFSQSENRFKFMNAFMMKSGMILKSHYCKILYSIIGRIVVDVMNNFRSFNLSTKTCFHDIAMLWDILLSIPNSFIHSVSFYSFAAPSFLTFASAGKPAVFSSFRFVRPTNEILFAIRTFFVNCRFSPRKIFSHTSSCNIYTQMFTNVFWVGESH